MTVLKRWMAVLCSSIACCGVLIANEFALAVDGGAKDGWPCWRGPSGQGITTARNLPTQWGRKDSENVLWKSGSPPFVLSLVSSEPEVATAGY